MEACSLRVRTYNIATLDEFNATTNENPWEISPDPTTACGFLLNYQCDFEEIMLFMATYACRTHW